ncbi:unnamed protein product [Periconia digitata]|uniref:LicD/FKTN/FKRP nucleotidyltransferase domain-containing protein n=1 Tax=Periconia digitata TaxID=1303443 RepID=A0A9W4UE70_9PLEO|nr:unnamed protein product [Periconia digitata]
MRFSICAALVAAASMVRFAGASPVKRDLSKEQQQALKYFHEPGDSIIMAHYDARFYHAIVSDEERTQTQIHMVRAYLNFFRENDLDTWLAHGTLLGWWWNGMRLPWDWDLDTQVSGATLQVMGDKFNQTRSKYVPEDGSAPREYLLDVNTMIWERERGDGMNIIDARWIDVTNGLYIDITGLSETHPDTNPGQWVCKNYHRYQTEELYPMRETTFEGVPARVPYSYDKILIQEYQEKALIVTEFEGHAWNVQDKLWQKTPKRIQEEREAAERKQKEEEEARKKAEEEELKNKKANGE